MYSRNMRPLLVFWILLSLALVGAAHAAGTSFPPDSLQPAVARNPSGTYEAIWSPASGAHAQRLYLKDVRTGRTHKLVEFDRGVDVLWSPDGRRLAITNWLGSNVSEVIVLRLGARRRTNLADALYKSLGIQPEISGNDHIYFEALRWVGPKRLLFSVSGHGDRNLEEFKEYFTYDVSGVVRRSPTR
jgi:hypothetical protein